MYLPAHFEEKRTAVLHALMRAHPLATLVTLGDSGLDANHIPVETLAEPPPHGLIRGHVARANPVWRQYRADSEALAIFQGPQAYISPNFYPSKRETGEVVPTWNYAVVHARGTLRFVQDTAWLRAFVERLTVEHEKSREAPWGVEDAPPPYIAKMLSMIVGFEFSIASLTGKWKLSQNHTAANRRGVVKGLRAAAGEDALEIADMLSALDDERRDQPARPARSAGHLGPVHVHPKNQAVGSASPRVGRCRVHSGAAQRAGIHAIHRRQGGQDASGCARLHPAEVRSTATARMASACMPPVCATARRSAFAVWSSATDSPTSISVSRFCRDTGVRDMPSNQRRLFWRTPGQVLSLQRIVAITSPDNWSSIAVLEKIGSAIRANDSTGRPQPRTQAISCRQARLRS